MGDISRTHILIYRLVKAIEEYNSDSIRPYVSTIASYLSGTDQKTDVGFYQKYSQLRGVLPKANSFIVLQFGSELISKGYLTKESIDGSILFNSTKTPFEEAEPRLIERLPKSKRIALQKLIRFVKDFCPDIVHKSELKYYAFQLPKGTVVSRWGDEVSWFWVTDNFRSGNTLDFKIRESPEDRSYDLYNFGISSLDEVVDVIKEVLTKKQKQFNLSVNFDARIGETTGAMTERINQSGADILFNDFILEDVDIYINKETPAMSALLSIGECSPFYFVSTTKYEPIEAALLAKGKSNFDFSMAKWKLVSWTTRGGPGGIVKDALLINKSNRSLWLVLSVQGKKVKCVSKKGFCIEKEGKKYSSSDLEKLVFGS